MYCKKCNCKQNSIHQTTIYSLPKVLIIFLDRGKDYKDFRENFEFFLDLDFSNKNNLYINPQEKNKKYYLKAAVISFGGSGFDGHFVAYCRKDSKSNFNFYNDKSVCTDKKPDDVLKTIISHNIQESYNDRIPYILFYHVYD
jgi:ubiquitin C-terminal hydrolase